MADFIIMVTVLIPLPVFYNADEQGVRKPIEDEKFLMTAEEVATEFEGGGTIFRFDHEDARGFWWHKGIVGYDVQALLEIDVTDTPDNREWFRRYAKEVLMARFQQIAIYLKFIGPIETLVISDEKIV